MTKGPYIWFPVCVAVQCPPDTVINAMHIILLKDGLMEKLDKRYKHYWRWLSICIILMRTKSAQDTA